MEFLKEKAAKIPGLSYFVIVATFLLLSKEPTVADAVLIFLFSWFFYLAGSSGISYSTGSTNPGRSLCRRPLLRRRKPFSRLSWFSSLSSLGNSPQSPRTCRERNSIAFCPVFSSAASAPGVATNCPKSNNGFKPVV